MHKPTELHATGARSKLSGVCVAAVVAIVAGMSVAAQADEVIRGELPRREPVIIEDRDDDDSLDSARRQQLQSARASVEQAEQALESARRQVRARFEAEQRFLQAQRDADAAQRQFQELAEPIRQRVRRSPQYQQLAEQDRQQQAQVAAAREGQAPGSTQPVEQSLIDAASDAMQTGQALTRLEQDAIDSDPQASTARQHLHHANDTMVALQREIDAKVAASAEVAQAQQALTNAQAQLAALRRQ